MLEPLKRHENRSGMAVASGDPGVLRVERYTRTAHKVFSTGSRIRQPDPVPRIEMIDLTQDGPAPSSPAG